MQIEYRIFNKRELKTVLPYRPPKVRIAYVLKRIRTVTVVGVVTPGRHFGWQTSYNGCQISAESLSSLSIQAEIYRSL